jgi:transcription-repair coupling factor (superfamily II helicase)
VYKKIAAVCNERDSYDLIDELSDRFGDIPRSVLNLITISKLRNTSIELGFTSIDQNSRMICLYNPKINMENCAVIASEDPFKGAVMISLGAKPHISYKLRDGEQSLDVCEKIINRYSKLTKN